MKGSCMMRAVALVVGVEVVAVTAGAWIVWRALSTPIKDPYQAEMMRRTQRYRRP